MPAQARPRVLITNAEERSMLAACRSLSAAGYDVSAAAFSRFAAAHGSRHCARRLRVADPARDAQQFVEDLARELDGGRYAALLPGSDRALLAISHWRERLEGLVRIGLPAPHALARSLDREVLATAAATAGFSPPESIRCAGAQEAIAAARTLGFPVILKSLHTVALVDATVQQAPPSRRSDTESELRSAIAGHEDTFLVQRTERGAPLSCAGVIAGGRLLALAVARYRRMWPPEAGNVAFAQTIDPPRALPEMVRELLFEIGSQGIFELELIETDDGRLVPIDLNPRPYGSMALAVAAGAPLPAIWCDWLLGREPQAVLARAGAPTQAVLARAGVRYRWEDADLRHFLWQLRRGHYLAAASAARPHRHTIHAHFQLSDPLPLLMRALYVARARRRAAGSSRKPDPRIAPSDDRQRLP